MTCLSHTFKFWLFIVSSIFSAGGMTVSATKLFLSDDPSSEALYISIFTSIITLWLPSPSQALRKERNKEKVTDLPMISSGNTSPSSSEYQINHM